MENLEKDIKFRDHYESVNLLGVDNVSQIEEGSLFGLVFSKGDLYCITPSINYNDDGSLGYYLSDYCDLEDMGIDVDNESLNEDLPFIFRKMKGNLAQEVLSGEIFVLSGYDLDKRENGLYTSLTPVEFQRVEPQYSNNNVLINCCVIENVTEEQIPNGFFQINDDFKSAYGYYTLPNKEKIIEAIKSIKKQSKKYFDDDLAECITKVQNIAETDNFLYDLEHSTSENKPKSR